MKEHKYAQVLRWIADGMKIQWDRDGAGSWVNANADQILYAIGSGAAVDPSRFRLAPATITINGVEIEAPFLPEDGEECWCFNMNGRTALFIAGQEGTEQLIRNGNCFRTSEAAKAAFEAVSKALKGGA